MAAQAVSGPPPQASPSSTPLSPRRQPLEQLGSAALVVLACAAVVYLSFSAGGYFPSAPGFVAIVFAQALAVRTLLAERPFEGFSRALAVPLCALVLYMAWELCSALWSHAAAATMDGYDRTLLYVLGLTLCGCLRQIRARTQWFVRAMALAVSAALLIGLTSRILPHVWPIAPGSFNNRLNYPLSYWNAEGMFAAIALVLLLHLSSDPRERGWVKVLAALLAPAIAVTLLLTFSRGALGVAIIGLLAYLLLTRARTLPGALIAGLPTCAVALKSAYDATLLASNNAETPAGVAQGQHVAIVVGVCMLVAGALRALLLLAESRLARVNMKRLSPIRLNLSRRARVALGSGLAGVVILVALLAGGASYLHREYEQFVQGDHGPGGTQTRERLTSIANDGRLPLWKVALDMYSSAPVLGTGAETYQQYYPRYRTEAAYVSDAHSLYVQSLGELGIVGLALIALVVASMLVGLAVRIRGPDRPLYAALFALVLAWSIHQAVDWDWQMPAVTLPVLLLAGLALARPADGKIGFRGLPASRGLVALAWLLIAITPLLISVSYARLQSAGEALRVGDCAQARGDALSSLSYSAERPQAYTMIGLCDLRQGLDVPAVAAMGQALQYEPRSWENHYWLALAQAAAGEDPRAAMLRARALNPLESMIAEALHSLAGDQPSRWEAAAAGLREKALASGRFTVSHL